MGRLRKSSRVIEKAQLRLQNIKAISPALDLGGGLTVASFDTAVERARGKLDEYNQALSAADQKYNDLLAEEKNIADVSARVLVGVAARFGKDSNEYEMAGGTRKSERKRAARSDVDPPASTV